MTTPSAPSTAVGDPHGATQPATRRAALAIVGSVVLVDQVTKVLAERHLQPLHTPHEVIGDLVRFTLTYNPGAAFGMHLGDASRWIFMALTVFIVGFLVRLFRSLPAAEHALKLAIAAVIGGAIGNFIDRVRNVEGVVDFIDVGVGDVRFWTFNVADAAVSVGAVVLVLLLWRYESRLHADEQHASRGRAADAPAGAGAEAGTADR